MVAFGLVLFWSQRLTRSYFRREGWEIGRREDWRFEDMRRKAGRNWWWQSFFLVYISQQLMLMGLTLPLYAISTTSAPGKAWLDTLAAAICLSGILIADQADSQLFKFVEDNKRRKERGEEVAPVLNLGLWRWSRHPNYFGEQLFWWGFALFAVNVGQPWALIGTLFNSICMLEVTRLTEERMVANPTRAAEYQAYQAQTSMWIPLPSSSHQELWLGHLVGQLVTAIKPGKP